MLNSVYDFLQKESLMSKEQLDRVISAEKTTGKDWYSISMEGGFLNVSFLLEVLSKKYNICFTEIQNEKVDKEASEAIPFEIAKKYNVFPFGLRGGLLHVAMADPFKEEAIDLLRFMSRKNVKPYLAKAEVIRTYITKYYSEKAAVAAEEDLKKHYKNHILKSYEDVDKKDLGDAPAVRLVDYIFNSALRSHASDIHIEPYKYETIVRLRIDGILSLLFTFDSWVHPFIVSRIKIISNMDTSEKRIPQDGKLTYNFADKTYDFRVSSLPTIFGEKLALRVIYKIDKNITLSELGLDQVYETKLIKLLKASSGIVLVTGPTGSGKSTTIYSMLNILKKTNKNIITIEDPVEYNCEGINQVSVNPKVGLDFVSGLKSILRQDPDIIMVGEIRDIETAEIAVRAAITGHLVLSTLHTKDASGSIARLSDMGIPHYLLREAILAVIAQRLVRKLCPFCKQEYFIDEDEENLLHYFDNKQIYKAKGCEKCRGTGYIGRTAVTEFLNFDEIKMKGDIKDFTSERLREYAQKHGMLSLKEQCKRLVLNGVTSLEEMVRVIYSS